DRVCLQDFSTRVQTNYFMFACNDHLAVGPDPQREAPARQSSREGGFLRFCAHVVTLDFRTLARVIDRALVGCKINPIRSAGTSCAFDGKCFKQCSACVQLLYARRVRPTREGVIGSIDRAALGVAAGETFSE